MINKIQILQPNLNFSQKKADKKLNIANYTANKFVSSNKSLSFGSDLNIKIITDFLYKGIKPSSKKDIDKLRKEGLGAIINFGDKLSEELLQYLKEVEVPYFHLPFDEKDKPTKKLIDMSNNLIQEQIDREKIAYLCCNEGRNRSVLMAGTFEVLIMGKKFCRTFEKMLAGGFDFINHSHLGKHLAKLYVKKTGANPDLLVDRANELMSTPAYRRNLDIHYKRENPSVFTPWPIDSFN